ncbi:HNH endonuclease signature motif containing protein [soil metagenome]
MSSFLLDPTRAETRVEFSMAEAEVAQHAQRRASATVFRAIEVTLREAAAHPEVFVDDVYVRGDAVELSIRAAVADLAVRLNLSEAAVRSQAAVASTLRERLPQVWAWFVEGEISTQNACEASSAVLELPATNWAAFDNALLEPAKTLAPARFRTTARSLRERLHGTPLPERRAAAFSQRRVWSEGDRDGMGYLGAYLPTEQLALANAHIDGLAFALFTDGDESRTMSQLRADVLADLLTGAGSPSSPTVTVALTIPALAVLGHSDEPAIMEGVGPIDLEIARSFAAAAPSITRLLTDPFGRQVLQMDPRQYRTSAALRRWFRIQHLTCDFPGCGRRAVNCDLDHTVAHSHGGETTTENLAPRCRKHHTMKHHTRWRVEKLPGARCSVWISPTGYEREADPPPF